MTFVPWCSEGVYESHDQRDTSKMIFEVRALDLIFAMKTRRATEANVKSPALGKAS
jgi:hypothetical protein